MTVARKSITLDAETWRRLQVLARERGKTPVDFLHDLIEERWTEQGRSATPRFFQVLETLRQIRERNARQWGVYEGDLLAEIREERIRQMEDVWSQWS